MIWLDRVRTTVWVMALVALVKFLNLVPLIATLGAVLFSWITS